jgi:hypothetical protein
MKAEIWEIELSYTLLELICGISYKFKELYIPALNHSFNFTYDNIHVLNNVSGRYKSKSTLYLCQFIKPKLIKTLELDLNQIQLYQKLIKKSNKSKISNFEINDDL